MKQLFKLAFVVLLPAAAVGQMPALAPGKIAVRYEWTYNQTKRIYLLGDVLQDGPTLKRYRSNATYYLGITPRITAIWKAGFYERNSFNRQVAETSGTEVYPGALNSGIGDQEIGANYQLFERGKTTLQATIRVGIPTGESTNPDGLLTGDGEWDQTIGLQVLRQLSSKPIQIYLAAGFKNRTRGFADEVVYDAFARYQLKPNLGFQFRSRGTQSLYNTDYYKDDGTDIGGTKGLYANATAFYTAEPSVRLRVHKKAILEIGASRVLVADNYPGGWTGLLSLEFQVGKTRLLGVMP